MSLQILALTLSLSGLLWLIWQELQDIAASLDNSDDTLADFVYGAPGREDHFSRAFPGERRPTE